MITNIDPGKMMFLSVELSDGSMEVFEDIKDAVAHASGLVEHGGGERGIFVAVPRARVHMGVRVDPIDPPAMPAPAPVPYPSETRRGEDWVRAQGLVLQPTDEQAIADAA
jgi:hypothetical protein